MNTVILNTSLMIIASYQDSSVPKSLISYDAEGRVVRLANLASGKTISVYRPKTNPRSLYVGGEGTEIGISDGLKSTIVLDPESLATYSVLKPAPFSAIASTNDGIIVAGDKKGDLNVIVNQQYTFVVSRSDHKAEITSLSFSPSFNYVASGSFDCTAIIWRMPTIDKICVIQDQGHPIAAVLMLSDAVVATACLGVIRIWNAMNGACYLEIHQSSTGNVTSLSLSPNGRLFASGSSGKTIMIYDTSVFEAVYSIQTTLPVKFPCFVTNDVIAIGADDSEIITFNIVSGKPVKSFTPQATLSGLAVFPPIRKFNAISMQNYVNRIS